MSTNNRTARAAQAFHPTWIWVELPTAKSVKGAQNDFGRLGACRLRIKNGFGGHLTWRGEGIEVHVCGQEGLRRGYSG